MSYSSTDFQDDVVRTLYNAGHLPELAELDDDGDSEALASAVMSKLTNLIALADALKQHLPQDPTQDTPDQAKLRAIAVLV